jgi:N-acyl-D-aspartate/D-glutamate deacylase
MNARNIRTLVAIFAGAGGPGATLVSQTPEYDVVIDPATLKDKATYFEPYQYSEGINVVLVNGKFVVDGGRSTGAKPGQVLQRQRTKRASPEHGDPR